MRTRLSSKGQVVLPRSVRRKLGLQPGESLDVEVEDGRIVLERAGAVVKKTRILKNPVSGLPVRTVGHGGPKLTSDQVKEILAEFP